MIHYHEIGLKGKNRAQFEYQLIKNLQQITSAYKVLAVRRIAGYIVVEPWDFVVSDELVTALAAVPGVARVSIAYRTQLVVEDFQKAAVAALHQVPQFESFKVHARKSATDFDLHTLDLNRLVGDALCAEFPEKKVQMHHPDITVVVHIVQGRCFVYARSVVGVGGLPVGTAGKVVTLLSSGFDSPVATWMLGRRGAICVPVHFSGRPQTNDSSEYLCQDIIEALSPSAAIGRLYVVVFGEAQRQIAAAVPQSLRILMYRRMMMQVCESIAQIEGAQALVTGESLGQVASQTLENIAAVNEATTMPILRPLIGSDKQEIIARAHEINTYDISALDAADCCTLFMPKKPETHARMDAILRAWNSFDHEGLREQLLDTIEWRDFSSCGSYRPPKQRWTERHNVLELECSGRFGCS